VKVILDATSVPGLSKKEAEFSGRIGRKANAIDRLQVRGRTANGRAYRSIPSEFVEGVQRASLRTKTAFEEIAEGTIPVIMRMILCG